MTASLTFKHPPTFQQLAEKWTRETMHQFLQDPQAFAPGTIMGFPDITDTTQRNQIIDFMVSGNGEVSKSDYLTLKEEKLIYIRSNTRRIIDSLVSILSQSFICTRPRLRF